MFTPAEAASKLTQQLMEATALMSQETRRIGVKYSAKAGLITADTKVLVTDLYFISIEKKIQSFTRGKKMQPAASSRTSQQRSDS